VSALGQPEVNEQAVLANHHLLDQQLDDPLLLGWEQFVPRRVELLAGVPDLILGRFSILTGPKRRVDLRNAALM